MLVSFSHLSPGALEVYCDDSLSLSLVPTSYYFSAGYFHHILPQSNLLLARPILDIIWLVYELLRAAVTQHHNVGVSGLQKSIVSQSLRLKALS